MTDTNDTSVGDKKPAAVVGLDSIAEWVTAYRQAADNVKQWEEIRDRAKAKIVETLGDAEAGTLAGRPAVRNTIVYSGRVDTKKLREEFPDIVDRFTRTTAARRFTLVDRDT